MLDPLRLLEEFLRVWRGKVEEMLYQLQSIPLPIGSDQLMIFASLIITRNMSSHDIPSTRWAHQSLFNTCANRDEGTSAVPYNEIQPVRSSTMRESPG